jgi:hypothetical protein
MTNFIIIAVITLAMLFLSMINQSESLNYASANDWSQTVSGGYASYNKCGTLSVRPPLSRGRYISTNQNSNSNKLHTRCECNVCLNECRCGNADSSRKCTECCKKKSSSNWFSDLFN